MVEVFKTNVTDQDHANMLADEIRKTFIDYMVNFDLEDCDKILRVKSTTESIQSSRLINLIEGLGYAVEILPDEALPMRWMAEERNNQSLQNS